MIAPLRFGAGLAAPLAALLAAATLTSCSGPDDSSATTPSTGSYVAPAIPSAQPTEPPAAYRPAWKNFAGEWAETTGLTKDRFTVTVSELGAVNIASATHPQFIFSNIRVEGRLLSFRLVKDIGDGKPVVAQYTLKYDSSGPKLAGRATSSRRDQPATVVWSRP